MKKLAHKDVVPLVAAMARRICDWQPLTPILEPKCFPVPRGGIPVAYMLLTHFPNLQIVDDRELADFFVDDLVDSGETRDRYMAHHPGKGFFALLDKGTGLNKDMNWYMFPWEIRDGGGDASGTDNITRLLQFIGEDPKREGLKETPDRVVKAWRHWCSGYGKDPATVLKVFEDGAEGCDQMVVRKDIPLYSTCVIGSTFVETPKGRVPISRLKDGDWIYTMDPKIQELKLVRCNNPRITKRDAALVAVHTDNDTLICTPDHRILTTDGEWVEAQNLKSGQRLSSLYRGTCNYFNGTKAYSKLIASRYTRWKGDVKINGISRGVPEHRFVKGQIDGVDYSDGRRFVTHHKDEQLWNNSPENLEVISIKDHNLAHQRTQKLASSQARKDAAALSSGRDDVRKKRSASVKAYWDKVKADKDAYAERCQITRDGILASPRNHVVIGVQSLDYTEDVWCMNVPETSLFFANGIAVHNCEHHMAAIIGSCTVAYIPRGKVVGLSKLDRLVDIFARRLQVQERLTNQIADALQEHLNPVGVGVWINARHLCVESRGVQHRNSDTITTALRGAIRDEPAARAEFLALARTR